MNSHSNSQPWPITIAVVEDHYSAYPLQEALQELFDLRWCQCSGFGTPDLAENVRALVTTTGVGADSQLIDCFPNLELVAVAGGHVDRVDHEHLGARNIPLCATPGVSSADVADFTMGLILSGLRQLCLGDRIVQGESWPDQVPPLGRSLSGRRLGIVGLGRIGKILARRAEAFDMLVRYTSRQPKEQEALEFECDLIQLAAWSEVLAVTCSSGPDTQGLIDDAVLAALGEGGYLVSISRGAVKDDAVLRALDAAELQAVALDTIESEPVVPDVLLNDPRVIITPHMASKTFETKWNVAALVRDNLISFFAGRPLLSPVSYKTTP